jgi:hypothetical protein
LADPGASKEIKDFEQKSNEPVNYYESCSRVELKSNLASEKSEPNPEIQDLGSGRGSNLAAASLKTSALSSSPSFTSNLSDVSSQSTVVRRNDALQSTVSSTTDVKEFDAVTSIENVVKTENK